MASPGDIAVIGEAVADAFPSGATADGLDLRVRPGGSPANAAVALARLGVPTRFAGRLSGGALGTLLRDHLAASNVDLSATVTAPGSASLAIASVDAEGRTSYDFYLRGTTDWGWTGDELAAVRAGGAACVHTGSLALVLEPGGPAIERLLAEVRPGATVCIDPNVRPGIVPAAAYQAGIERWSRLADILRFSDEDLAVLRPDGDFPAACAGWHAAGVRLVVLTRGPSGAVASLDGTRIEVPAVPVSVVDTVGAGDSFTAGLLRWLWQHGHLGGRLAGTKPDDVAQAMGFAAAVAARTCAVQGADPPWAADLGR
ncbi:MAG TPA: carbohydrate kinase [Rugosimonospora sp.]|nr:carbohydrate kinase [Rugosimonospora sp.]